MVAGDGIQYGLSFVAGSLSTLSPCVFPLLPLVVGGVVHAHHHTGQSPSVRTLDKRR